MFLRKELYGNKLHNLCANLIGKAPLYLHLHNFVKGSQLVEIISAIIQILVPGKLKGKFAGKTTDEGRLIWAKFSKFLKGADSFFTS
jgi:hypothetical protein